MIINLLRCLISGVLFALAFNTSFWILALFAGIPLFQAFLQKNSVKQRLLYISAFGIPFFIISLCWLYEFSKILEFSDFQRALIITIALILIALYLTVYWAVPLIIFGGKLKENTKSVIAFSCIFVLGEWLQSLFYPLAFPWSRLANIIAPFTPFIQSASLFGSLFISLIILLFNGFSALVINNLKEQKKFNHKNRYFRCAVSVVLGNIVLGFFANIFLYNSSDNKSELNVLMVQGNFPGLVRWYSEDEMFKTYINLIEENITTETDLVLTPEIAIPFNFYKDTEKQQKLLDICAENDVILVLGIWTTENNYDYNSMLCLYPDGTYSDVYSKKRLVPFAERLILDDVIDKIFPTLLNNYTVTEGYKNTVFNTYWDCELIEKKAERKMGGVICYESIFPDIVRKTVNSGAEFITFLTDDSWFGSTCALKQHTSHSMLRAVENNIPWLQCSNTGITCIINQNGEMTEDIDIQKSGILSGTVEIQATYNERNKTTLYTFWGDYPVILMILCFLIYFKFKKEVLQ